MALRTVAQKTVSAANTATQLTTTRTPAHAVYITANPNNTELLWIGDSNVSTDSNATARGTPIAPGETKTFVGYSAPNAISLHEIYFSCSDASGAGLVTYVEV